MCRYATCMWLSPLLTATPVPSLRSFRDLRTSPIKNTQCMQFRNVSFSTPTIIFPQNTRRNTNLDMISHTVLSAYGLFIHSRGVALVSLCALNYYRITLELLHESELYLMLMFEAKWHAACDWQTPFSTLRWNEDMGSPWASCGTMKLINLAVLHCVSSSGLRSVSGPPASCITCQWIWSLTRAYYWPRTRNEIPVFRARVGPRATGWDTCWKNREWSAN